MKNKVLNIINSKIFLLIFGFILTGLVGSFLNYRFQKESWKRQANHEAMKKQLNQTYEGIEEIMLQANKRFYSMQKVFWSLESSKQENAQEKWIQYNHIKDDWNINLGGYRSKIKVFLNPKIAYELLGEEDARDYQNKGCLHSYFVVTHYKLKQLLEYSGFDEKERKEIELSALNSLSELGKRIRDFSDKCYQAYIDKYNFFKKLTK
jgi:hypothetical protein